MTVLDVAAQPAAFSPNVFAGPVVFIDDEVDTPDSPAFMLIEKIKSSGLPVIPYRLPPDPESNVFKNWRGLAFLVLDWDFVSSEISQALRAGGSQLDERNNLSVERFLARFLKEIFCPVFLISDKPESAIRSKLIESNLFLEAHLDARVKILSKAAVEHDLFAQLENWVIENGSMLLLGVWEAEYERAKNQLFGDFHALIPAWPSAFWRAAQKDNIDPSFELVSVITANLLNRINAIAFDERAILSQQVTMSGTTLRRVLQGRTVLARTGLHDGVIMPGDFFAVEGDDQAEPDVWINLSPACHTIAGRGDVAELDDVEVYLVKARPTDYPTSQNSLGKLEASNPNKSVIHALLGDHPYVAEFKDARIARWGEVGRRRIGRILSPYITKLQQSNAMFMQIQGLPTITKEFYDID